MAKAQVDPFGAHPAVAAAEPSAAEATLAAAHPDKLLPRETLDVLCGLRAPLP